MSESNVKDQVEAIEQDPMAMFHTRQASNEGIKLDLVTPSGGKTEHWLQVLGVDSDAFRNAELQAKREGHKLTLISDEVERMAAMRDLQLKPLAAVVLGWSFSKPCTYENVFAFLREAPQIADAIDMMISRRALFFAKRSIDSMSTLDKSSDLT